jgi:hypothetical protein
LPERLVAGCVCHIACKRATVGHSNERREFITLLGGAFAWPLAARAQQTGKLPTIGYLGTAAASAWAPWTAAFVQRLHELGWIEGRTIAIQYRWAEGHNERLADIARFEDYVTRQGTKILKLDRRELPTPPRCIHRKACGVTAVTAVSHRGRWRRAEAPTSLPSLRFPISSRC